MQEAAERVSLVINDRMKSPLICRFGDNRIQFSCTTPLGSANDSISCEMQGDEVEIGFNSRFLQDALKNSETDELTLELGGALSPMKLLPVSGDGFLFLVLPVRI